MLGDLQSGLLREADPLVRVDVQQLSMGHAGYHLGTVSHGSHGHVGLHQGTRVQAGELQC